MEQKTDVYITEEIQKAKQVANNDLLLSDELSMRFNTALPSNFTKAAAQGREAVVYIESSIVVDTEQGTNRRYAQSTGSGVIISNDGYIVTNHHVVKNADKVIITLNNNKEYQAQVIGFDEMTDLALLKVEDNNLPFLVFGNSDSLLIGEWVLAIGNPFRLQSTVTAGIVSAKARNINILEQSGIESFIQTDAAVNPGNSGGALINTHGELVGINTAILTSSGGYEGFSFAAPSQLVRKIVRDLKEFGTVQRGWMGVTIININADLAEELGLKMVRGVYLDGLTADGAAKIAGLQTRDVILSVNDVPTDAVPQFMELIAQHRPGDKLKVKYFRDGLEKEATVTLRNQLNTLDFVGIRKDKLLTDLGFELRELDSREKSKSNGDGVYVVSVYRNSKIGLANLEPGYIITSINKNKVKSVNDILDFINDYTGTVVLNGFYENYPGDFPYTFTIDSN